MDTAAPATDSAADTAPYRFVDRDGLRILMVEGADPSLCMTVMRLDDVAGVFSAVSRVMLQWASFMPQAKEVVVIGLGGGEIAKFVHERMPQVHLTAVEIDPAMVLMARRHFGLMPDDERLSVIVGDGAEHVRSRAPGSCDVLLLDAYDNDYALPAAFVGEDFAEVCQRVLSDDGLMCVNLLRRSDAWINEHIRMLTQFFQRVVHLRLSAEQVMLLAFKRAPQLDWAEVHQRAQALEPEFRLGLPDFASQLEQCLQGPVLQPAPTPA